MLNFIRFAGDDIIIGEATGKTSLVSREKDSIQPKNKKQLENPLFEKIDTKKDNLKKSI